MLTRNAIASGAYLEKFEALPEGLRWSRERIEQSLASTMRERRHPGDIWIFAYGSLIWNPLLDFAEQRPAVLHGWHRSFCLRIVAGRGTPEVQGRMLALEPGGSTQGVAFRLCETSAAEELRLTWIREMVSGSYCPRWADITLDDGSSARAIAFTANPAGLQYEADASVAAVAPMVAAASGFFGTNADYVFRLRQALQELGAQDDYIAALADELQRHSKN
jgi:cation transport protein ChaC